QSRDAPEIQGLTGDALASRIFLRARNYLLSDPNIRPMIEGQIDEFMVAFRRHVEGLAESSRFMDAVNRESGMAVESKLLGKKERESYPVGPITVSRTINNNTFQSMMTALRGSGWELAESMLKDAETLYDSADPADRARLEKALSMLVNHPAHGDTVTRLFLGEIARSPYPLIDAARLEDGVTRPTGDVNVIKSALEAATDPVTGRVNVLRWAEGMHSAYGAQGPVGQYVSDVISDLLDVYQRAKGLDARLNPETRPRPATLENLLPDVMIDARTIDDLPGTWFRYRTFDRMDNIRIIERLAGQLAFGRDSKRLANDFETARSEVRADVAKLEEIEEQARRRSPTGSTRDVKKTAAEISGSVQEYDRLRQSRRRLKILDQAFNGLYRHFREKNDPIGAWHVGLRFAQELAGLLVNQPSSAIAQMATLFDAAVRYGASPTILKTVGKTIKTSAKDLVGSLAQGIGWELFRNSWSEEESDFQRLGLGDPQSARRFGDVFIRYEHETQPMAFLRGMREAQAFGANRLGERARFTIMKPLAPFFTGITSANKGLTIALWSLAKNYVNRAIEFYGENPLDVGRTEALTSADLGLSGKLESDSFARFSRDLKSRGLDFDRMALAARERALHGDKTILTDRELALINEIALDEVSLESNIATTPLGMFNNTVLGMAMPLLGWSYRRMLQVAGLRLDTNEKNSLRALGTGLMGLTVAAGGGLALSAVIDWYMEHLVGKVRNLQPAFTGIRPNPAAMLERINRIGTFGFFGELANTAVNVGTGQGDNRAFSVDQRVIFMNSIQSVMTAMSNLINQHFVADYQHVTRPFIQAIGGGGMLQYMDVLDHSLGLDGLPVFGSEARIVARINAENYLRIAGRALNLSVRTGQAVGFGTPTPVTPYLSRMEMAAYANDAGDFKSAYLDAVQAARKQGKENPEAYVRAAFATRHPLRYVFQQPPTMQEYQQILNFLSERGREDVQSAIRLFNHYEEQIGVRPYIGRVQSRSTGQQARAMGASVFSSTP
ncbi:MAG: hypothetical protein KGI71_05865, partial [Patescibacteria group bacterium]|nr:hypothetical protein [Patescibacteria group bacterium]